MKFICTEVQHLLLEPQEKERRKLYEHQESNGIVLFYKNPKHLALKTQLWVAVRRP